MSDKPKNELRFQSEKKIEMLFIQDGLNAQHPKN